MSGFNVQVREGQRSDVVSEMIIGWAKSIGFLG